MGNKGQLLVKLSHLSTPPPHTKKPTFVTHKEEYVASLVFPKNQDRDKSVVLLKETQGLLLHSRTRVAFVNGPDSVIS